MMMLDLHVRRVMRDSIRMYFAPLTGAIKGIRSELHRVDREIAQHRKNESKITKPDAIEHAQQSL